ncbi:MAG: hypothetical protein AAGH90_11025 [Pseudomonadota bacterium]
MTNSRYTQKTSRRVVGLPCCVPFCAGVTKRADDDGATIWFCARHYQAIPKRWRDAWHGSHKAGRYDLFEQITHRMIEMAIEFSLSDRKARIKDFRGQL